MSSQPAQAQPILIPGPAGSLESLLEMPRDAAPRGSVVVCHPHPLHGGSMQNKVVYTLARAFSSLGFAALRFNFRGTGNSAGEYDNGNGELDDALAVLAWQRQASPQGPLWLAGFSFGAAIAIRAAIVEAVDGLVTVAPAVSRFAAGLEHQPQCPWLIVQGDADELVPVDETISWLNELQPGPELAVMSGAEHFFHGRLVELRSLVSDFVQKKAGDSPGF